MSAGMAGAMTASEDSEAADTFDYETAWNNATEGPTTFKLEYTIPGGSEFRFVFSNGPYWEPRGWDHYMTGNLSFNGMPGWWHTNFEGWDVVFSGVAPMGASEFYWMGTATPEDWNGEHPVTGFDLIHLHIIVQDAVLTDYSISYDANGGTGAPGPTAARSYSQMVDLRVTDDHPTRSGHLFTGWSRTADGSDPVGPGEVLTLTRDGPKVTLYAVWTAEGTGASKTYSLIFDANGGTGGPNDVSLTTTASSETLRIPAGVPVRDGFEFAGWSTDPDGSGHVYAPGDGVTINGAGTLQPTAVLYAVWSGSNPDGGLELPEWFWYAAAVGLILIVMMVRL